MDKHFGEQARSISSRAVAGSAYLFTEGLYVQKKARHISDFAKFYVRLLEEIKANLRLLSSFKTPKNPTILEEFQKYISQASVEPYAIKRRNLFLEKAFKHYLDAKTKGKIIGGR